MAANRPQSLVPHVSVPTTLVIFGATGALAKRKLFPSLLKLAREGVLPKDFRLVGVSPQQLSDDVFASQVRETLSAIGPVTEEELAAILKDASHLALDV